MRLPGLRWLAPALLLAGCATLQPPAGVPVPPAEPLEAWARVLERFVDDQGRVDFRGLAQDRQDLDRYVAWVGAVSPESHPERFPTPEAVLAYHLNAYNALAMYAVIETGLPTTLAGLRKLPFFFMRRVVVGGEAMSLHRYENDRILSLGDPRVHFALNCMSVGCPRLPRIPFPSQGLDAVLEAETRRFFADPVYLRVDDAAQEVWVSEILRFYRDDFLKYAPSLIAYVNRYRPDTLPEIPEHYRLRFIPYDWTVNHQPT